MELLCLTFHHHNPLHGLVRNRKKITKPSILLQSDSHSETGLPELASKNAEHSVKSKFNLVSSAVFPIGQTGWPPSWADAFLFFFFFNLQTGLVAENWRDLVKEMTRHSLFLDARTYDPQERWPWEFSGQGHPRPAPRDSKPWAEQGPGAAGARQPGRTHPGPRLAFGTRCPSERAQQCLHAYLVWDTLYLRYSDTDTLYLLTQNKHFKSGIGCFKESPGR